VALNPVRPNPSPKELAWFGLVPVAFFGIVGLVLRFQFGLPRVALSLWILGAVIGVAYYCVTPLRKPIHFMWMSAFLPIGAAIWHVALLTLFFLVLTPTGLLMRLTGRDPLQRRFDKKAETYWVRQRSTSELDSYFRQF